MPLLLRKLKGDQFRMSNEINPFELAQKQFDRVADMLDLDDEVRAYLRWPKKEFHVRIPVRMDNGDLKIFDGYRVQHNDALGPHKGGLRFFQDETFDTVRALSMWMTWKCAVAKGLRGWKRRRCS